MVDEETPLTGGTKGTSEPVLRVNIERLRFVGLSAMIVLLIVGNIVTENFVVFPATDNPSSGWDKLLGRAPSDFHEEKTLIFWLFKFNHTCTVLDFNPSKTVSALLMMVHTVPIDLFIILSYYRIKGENDNFKYLKIYAKYASIFQFVCVTYFYMVFVNSPDGEPNTQEGINSFIKHYIPYMLWQTAMFLMAIQQCWYISLKDVIPFPWISRRMLRIYLYSMGVMLVIYTWFIWSFIIGFGEGLWDTSTDFGRICAMIVMWVWNGYCIIIPLICAWIEAGNADAAVTEIVFNN